MKRVSWSTIFAVLAALGIGRCTSDFDCPRVVARTTTTSSPSGLVADHRVTAGDFAEGWPELFGY